MTNQTKHDSRYPVCETKQRIQDVFIVSCGDAPSLERNLIPQIARIDLRSNDIGRRAVDRLFQRIQTGSIERKVLLLDPSLSIAN